MHTTFDHPQFAWPKFHQTLNLPPLLWSNAGGGGTYVDADDVAIYEAGTATQCPHRHEQRFDAEVDCWSGNCHLAANELFAAGHHLDADTCEGYVSDGPFSCTCNRCRLASEPPEPNEGTTRPFWRVQRMISCVHRWFR